jgi:hypothetical protein
MDLWELEPDEYVNEEEEMSVSTALRSTIESFFDQLTYNYKAQLYTSLARATQEHISNSMASRSRGEDPNWFVCPLSTPLCFFCGLMGVTFFFLVGGRSRRLVCTCFESTRRHSLLAYSLTRSLLISKDSLTTFFRSI